MFIYFYLLTFWETPASALKNWKNYLFSVKLLSVSIGFYLLKTYKTYKLISVFIY